MKLVIGGAYQGKRAYAEEHDSIQKWANGEIWLLQEGKEQYVREQLIPKLLQENPGIVLVTNELGYGIVPIDPFDRSWRELTGRICTELAEHADEVTRVVCGIPVVLK